MMVFLLSFIVVLVVVSGMSIGVILANKPIKGSCGGMSALGIDTACDICGGDKNRCEKETMQKDEDKLSYNAVNKNR